MVPAITALIPTSLPLYVPPTWLLHTMSDPEKRVGQVEIEPIAKDVVFGQVVELVGDYLESKSIAGPWC